MLREFKPGLIVKPIESTRYFLGASPVQHEVLFPEGQDKYIPDGEKQATRYFDPWSCVSESLKNIVNTILNRLMELHPQLVKILDDLGLLDENKKADVSERFLAVMSGTVPGRGNSQFKVIETLRKCGICGEKDWPSNDNMTEAEYFATIPQSVKDKALKVLEYLTFSYESIPHANFMVDYATAEDMAEAQKMGGLWGCVDGRYEYHPDGLVGDMGRVISWNHCVDIYNQVPVKCHKVLDSYEPFKKDFIWDYKFGYPVLITIQVKKKNYLMLIKESGNPSVYCYSGLLDCYFPIKDLKVGEEVIAGGDILKTFCGEYKNAKIFTLPVGIKIPADKIKGTAGLTL